jgi:hypothetical protein
VGVFFVTLFLGEVIFFSLLKMINHKKFKAIKCFLSAKDIFGKNSQKKIGSCN